MKIILSPGIEIYRQFFAESMVMDMKNPFLTWRGANTLYLKSSDSGLLVDPYFSRLPGMLSLPYFYRKLKPDIHMIEQGLKELQINQVNAILLTHTHFDHAMDIEEICRLIHTEELYTPLLIYRKFQDLNTPFESRMLEDKLSLSIGNFDIKVHKGNHMPFPIPTIRMEQWVNRRSFLSGSLSYAWQYSTDAIYSFNITISDKSIFIMGSAGLPSTSLNGQASDILLLSLGGLDLLSRRYCDKLLSRTIDELNPKTVLLSHWDDFTIHLDEPVRWLKKANRIVDYIITRNIKRGIKTRLLIPGQTIDLLNIL